MARSSSSEIIASVDIGTSKIVALIAEINGDNELKIIGVGTEPSRGLKKGVVVNIESTVDSIGKAIKQAERIAECDINTVFAGIAGSHVRSYDGHGFVRINEGEVSQEDIDGAVDASIAMKIPSEERILHVLPKDFVIDGQDGISEPIGMSGIRLEADVHIVTISRTAEENIVKSLDHCDLDIQEVVLEPLASSMSVLSQDEKELGACLIDIGGGTTDIAIFKDGQIITTKVIPVGGDHVTRDIAHELKTPVNEAEIIKIEHAATLSKLNGSDTLIDVPSVGDREARKADRKVLASVVEQRYEEIFEVINTEVGKISLESLRAGVILTGGASKLDGAVELAETVFGCDVRLGYPKPMSGAFESINGPENATGAGLLLYALEKYKSKPDDLVKQKSSAPLFQKIQNWFSSNL